MRPVRRSAPRAGSSETLEKVKRLDRSDEASATVALAPAISPRAVFRRFWPWVRCDRYWLLAGSVLVVAGAGGQVLAIWLFKALIDNVLIPHHFSAFWPLAGIMIGSATVSAMMTFLGEYTATWVAERFLLRLRTAVVAHLHTLPPDTLRARWHGDMVARLTLDISHVEQLVASGVIEAGSALISLLFFAGAAFYLSWPLALTVVAVAPLFWLAARAFTRRIQKLSREARRRDGGVTAVVEESLANSSLAYAYNQQDREVSRVRQEGKGLLRAELATARVAHFYPALLDILEVIGGLVVVGLGAFELTKGALTLGGLLAFAAFMTELFGPVQHLSGLATMFGSASAGAERVIELFETRTPVSDRPGADAPSRLQGILTCENVSAAYPGGKPVLREVTFRVAPGQILAVMGPSGVGKSTLAKLLVRFMDPAAGSVRLDGIDLRDLTAASVRRAVTLLPQQAQLFHASIRDNIAYGRPGAGESEIVQAAKAAGAHDFVTALPGGYGSVIGEEGFQLSGGQAQRIAIARAFLRATPVLVLDEPTAGLDVRAAVHVLGPLRRLMAGRTTVLITHDHALARHADAVYLLHGGAGGAEEGERQADGAGARPRLDDPPASPVARRSHGF
jgi:ABC-type multidrug transport system fused ATPase/permease subunit